MIAWKSEGTKVYQQLTKDIENEWKVCDPLREIPKGNENFNSDYKTWNESREE